jgi:hypothetical protein
MGHTPSQKPKMTTQQAHGGTRSEFRPLANMWLAVENLCLTRLHLFLHDCDPYSPKCANQRPHVQPGSCVRINSLRIADVWGSSTKIETFTHVRECLVLLSSVQSASSQLQNSRDSNPLHTYIYPYISVRPFLPSSQFSAALTKNFPITVHVRLSSPRWLKGLWHEVHV